MIKFFLFVLSAFFIIYGTSKTNLIQKANSLAIQKKQIGTSIWFKNGEIVSDSIPNSHIIFFDDKGRRTEEWKIEKRHDNDLFDSSYVKYDTLGHEILLNSKDGKFIRKYDIHGNVTELYLLMELDTVSFCFNLKYDRYNKLTKTTQTNEGNQYGKVTKIEYLNNKVFKTNSSSEYEAVYDNQDKIIYSKEYSFRTKVTTIIEIKRDKFGRILKYTLKDNNKLIKKIEHFYNGIQELKKIENFYSTKSKSITYYKTEYW